MADMFDRFRAMTIRNLQPRSSGGKGMPGTLVRKERTYNPDTDLNETVDSTYSISGLRATFALRHVDGELIRISDVKFYLSPVLINGEDCPTPLTTDQIQLDEKVYTVVSVKDWDNAGVVCGWQVQLRTA